MVDNRLGSFSHRFQKIILRRQITPNLSDIRRLARRMNPRLTLRRSDTDRYVLQRSAETTHHMALEMGQYHRKIVIEIMRPYDIFFQVLAVLHRKCHFTVGIHDIDRRNSRESMRFGCFQMVGRCGATAAVSRIALDNGTVHLLHQWRNQSRLQEVMASRFTRGEFHRNPTRCRTFEHIVDTHQIFWRDFPNEIDFRARIRRLGRTAG